MKDDNEKQRIHIEFTDSFYMVYNRDISDYFSISKAIMAVIILPKEFCTSKKNLKHAIITFFFASSWQGGVRTRLVFLPNLS